MRQYSASEFARRLGGRPEDWGFQPHWTVTVDENMRIVVDGQTMGHVNQTERAMLERTSSQLQVTGADLERKLGSARLTGLGIRQHDIVVIDKDDWIRCEGRPLAQLHPEDREILEAPHRALATINRFRASAGQPPLDPAVARWEDEDIYLEAHRIARLQNPRSWRGPAFAGVVGRGLGTGIGLGVAHVAKVATPTKELERAKAVGAYAGGTLGAATGAFVMAPSGKRWHAALGAMGANVLGLATLPFGPWWVANAVGIVATPIGIYFAVAPRRSRRSNPMSPRAKRWLWIGGIVGGVMLVGGGVAYAKIRRRDDPLDPEDAVEQAVAQLGEDADPDDLADVAYPLAYPECPQALDPEDESHATCIEHWMALRDLAKSMIRVSEKDASPDPKATAGPAADVRRWLDSLSSHQRSEVRRILGATHYDPIKRAAEAGDDGKTRSAVLRLKRDIEKLMAEDKWAALAQYSELKKLLGPKLDELLGLAKKYQ